jgi:antitoxin (DNA-binding transcriptional repressor) of toxin-antitoxin stability system
MPTTVTVAELVTNLDDVLDRIKESGERFVVERDGEPIAVLTPPNPKPGITGRDLIARLGNLAMPGDGFADDLEAIQAAQQPASAPEWPD